ncbi:integral membrane protein [Diaporthe helianthi]|uniref:Integral membrane protein n=1 Tax=Diaporthe helianthi TaxID=158607 RepID=A0A2P5HTI5_DIAHE|nr:integral membrane protein [Diaporthe helianthi]
MPNSFPIERKDQKSIIAVGVVFSVLAVVAVGMRLVSRRIIQRRLDWSDFLIIAACITVVSYWATALAGVVIGGLGFHVGEIIDMYGHAEVEIAFQILWAIAGGLYKVSILLFYIDIFPTLKQWGRVTMAIIFCYTLSTTLAAVLVCEEIDDNWEYEKLFQGKCGDRILVFRVTGALNIVSDVVVLLLPVRNVLKLQMPLYRRLVLLATFALGLLTCVISIVRLGTLTSLSPGDFRDTPYAIMQTVIWSGLEPSVAVILACVPLMRPLVLRIRGVVDSSEDQSKSMSGNGQSLSMRTAPRALAYNQIHDSVAVPVPTARIHNMEAMLISRGDSPISDLELGTIVHAKSSK